MQDFNQALDIGTQKGVSYYHRSLAYFAMDQFEDAAKDLEDAKTHGFQPPEGYVLKLKTKLAQP